MSDSFTVVIDIAMVDVYHVDVFQCILFIHLIPLE